MNTSTNTCTKQFSTRYPQANKDALHHAKLDNQKGAALITLLLIVVIVTVLAATMLSKQNILIQQTNIAADQQHQHALLLSGEQHGLALLQQDTKNNKSDSNRDIWAAKHPLIKHEVGNVRIRVRDESGKFNLNNLVGDKGVDEQQKQIFVRLLTSLKLSGAIADAVIDWQDTDNTMTGSGGAEKDFYAGQGVVPNNDIFAHIDELKLVRGVTPQMWHILREHVMVAPVYSTINVNTATAHVLAALSDKLDIAKIENWQQTRKDALAFGSVADFLNEPVMSALKNTSSAQNSNQQSNAQQNNQPLNKSPANANNKNRQGANTTNIENVLSVESNVFVIVSEAMISSADTSKYLTSQVFKKDNTLYVTARQFGIIAPFVPQPLNSTPAN